MTIFSNPPPPHLNPISPPPKKSNVTGLDKSSSKYISMAAFSENQYAGLLTTEICKRIATDGSNEEERIVLFNMTIIIATHRCYKLRFYCIHLNLTSTSHMVVSTHRLRLHWCYHIFSYSPLDDPTSMQSRSHEMPCSCSSGRISQCTHSHNCPQISYNLYCNVIPYIYLICNLVVVVIVIHSSNIMYK